MAFHLLKILPTQTTIHSPPPIPKLKPLCFSLSIPLQQQYHINRFHSKSPHRPPNCSLSPAQDLSSTPYPPPSTREEAISQAKASLSANLQKPLSNPIPLPTRKLKKQRQPRFRVEIPVVDDSPGSLTQLAFDVFSNIAITRKGAKPTILIIWPTPTLMESARQVFDSAGRAIVNSELASVSSGDLGSADLVVFMAPDAVQLKEIKMVANGLDPRPVVLFNPKWAFEEEKGFNGGLGSFAGSFDVVYSFMGLEVRGILSRRKAVVFRCVRDGLLNGEGWVVMVEEGRKGELKVVSRFKRRPSIEEVESLLYNLMAANSPVTKSAKFIKDLASNITGRKAK